MMMAADVSSLARLLNRYKEGGEGKGKSRDLVTRDLLGGCDSKELDLDLKVPAGWEKRLDLVSGEVFFQRSSNSNSGSMAAPDHRHLQDLNFGPNATSYFPPPPPTQPSLELKLFPTSSSSSEYQSVCTLDKVKSALERASRQPVSSSRKRPHHHHLKQFDGDIWSSSPTSSSTTASSIKRQRGRGENEEEGESRSTVEQAEEEGGARATTAPPLLATGCPSCLSYVLVSRRNLRCPRCDSAVALPVMKKPRFDLDLNSAV